MPVDISVLIATRNRRSSLEKQFKAFEELDTEGLTFEILVVDNGSTDGTYEWLRRMASRFPVKVMLETRPGKNIALNRALPEAGGRLILFTDDDTLPVRSWLRDYHSAMDRWPGHSIFCGPIEPLFPPQAPTLLRVPGLRHAEAAFSSFAPALEEGVITKLPLGPNFAVRSRTLRSYRLCEDIGPSEDPKYTMGSDIELLQRLTADGEICVYLPQAKVSHIIRREQLTLKWLQGRGFRAGRSHARLKTDTSSTRLFGVPRYLWKQLVISGIRSGIHQHLHMPQRWDSAFEHKMIQGQIYEYRATEVASLQSGSTAQLGGAPDHLFSSTSPRHELDPGKS